NLTKWLERNYKNVISDHAMLVIDDESDYASVNTKKASDPTSINSKIRALLGLFRKRAYVAYTATPYANIFIDYKAENSQYGKDLFPKDFLYTLDAPTNYFGAKEVFIENPDRYLVEIDDHQDILPVKHKIDHNLQGLPLSLYEAIRVFLINVSIRNLRGHNNKHNSMLVHVSRFTIMHITVASEVEEYVSSIRKAVVSFSRLTNYRQESEHFKDLETTFNKQYVNKDIELEYDWSEVLDSLHQCIETIIIRQVHAKKTDPLVYNDLKPVNVIVVGGTSLSRGYTLEGLSVSYFLRGTMFYDTLMQMARWFGYRSGYQDLCRIYMTLDMMDNFTHIYEATKELFDSFIEMADQKKTPYDFGLAVVEHPSSALQVTARNKMNNTSQKDVAMRLEGLLKETAWIGKEQKDIDSNLKTVSDFVLDLNKKSNPETLGRSYLWRDVNWNDVDFFLQNFIVFTSDPFGVNSKMPIEFVKGFVLDNKGEWDISLHGGIGKKYKVGDLEIATEERKFKDKGGYFEVANRQISSGNSEAISIPDRKSIGSDRRKARCFPGRNNLLMLHILELEGDNGFVAAFGVSFSGDGSSGDKTIRLRMNKVMSDEISDFYYEEKKEEEYDD
ncbi:MAG: Z1 domain-containing protein, partial [Candidatus Thioglobus sp.]